MHWRRYLQGSLACLTVASALLVGCGEGRFPVCKTNADCQAKSGDAGTGANICYNLRCVECHYDTDCPAGKVCSSVSTCDAIGAQAGAKDGQKEDDPPPPPPSSEPGNWDECAKGCKDQACLSKCDARFHPK